MGAGERSSIQIQTGKNHVSKVLEKEGLLKTKTVQKELLKSLPFNMFYYQPRKQVFNRLFMEGGELNIKLETIAYTGCLLSGNKQNIQ